MREHQRIVTRAHHPDRFSTDDSKVVESQVQGKIIIESHPIYPFSLDVRPAVLTTQLWALYLSKFDVLKSRPGVFAHCVRQTFDRGCQQPSLQIFTDDYTLGNLNTEGFLRWIIDPNRSQEDNLRRINKKISELQRYVRKGVLNVKGFYAEQSQLQQPPF